MKIGIKLSVIAALCILTSCSMEKRHYRSGFSINWNAANRNTFAKKNSDKDNAPKNVISENSESSSPETSELLVSASAEAIAPAVVKSKPLLETKSLPKDSCDVIEMKSGKKIQAKIIEINPSTIKYKNCGDSQGHDRVISKEDIAGITYASGAKETEENLKYIAPEKPEATAGYREEPAKPTGPVTLDRAVKSLKLGITAFAPFCGCVFAIISIIMGIQAFLTIKKNPKKYTANSKKMAKAGMILGITGLLLGITCVILIFALLSNVGLS